MPDALVADDQHTYYGNSYVLQGVSISVKSRAVAAVLGRNGVGKTTLMRSLISFTPPRRGRVVLEGIDITRWPAHRVSRSGMSLVPQGRRIFPSLTVREHLQIARRLPHNPEAHAQWHADSVFDLFPQLRERSSHRAGTLSGGEQQMLAVARALMSNPRFLLMDEPTEGLSPFVVEDLKRLIGRLKTAGLSILLVEQNLEFALSVSDYVYVMDKGKIVFESVPGELMQNNEIKHTYLGV